MPENRNTKGVKSSSPKGKGTQSPIAINTSIIDKRIPLPEESQISPLSNLLLRTSLYGVKSKSAGYLYTDRENSASPTNARDESDPKNPPNRDTRQIPNNQFSKSMDSFNTPSMAFKTEKMQLRPEIAARTDSILKKFNQVKPDGADTNRNQFPVKLEIINEPIMARTTSNESLTLPALEPLNSARERNNGGLKSSFKSPMSEPIHATNPNSLRFANTEYLTPNSPISKGNASGYNTPTGGKERTAKFSNNDLPNTPTSSYLRDMPRFEGEMQNGSYGSADSINISRRTSLESQKSRITVNPHSATELIPELPPLELVLQSIENLNYDEHSPKKLAVDAYGFLLDSNDSCLVQDTPSQQRKIKKLEKEWISILTRWKENSKKIKQLTRQGVPDSVRAQVWLKLADVKSRVVVGRFDQLLLDPAQPPIFEVIERDINRCYPNHQMFQERNGPG